MSVSLTGDEGSNSSLSSKESATNAPAATTPKELRSNDRRVSLAIRFLPFLALCHRRQRLASLFSGAIYDDRSAGSKAGHRNRQQPIWPMRFILNRVLLALILDFHSRYG